MYLVAFLSTVVIGVLLSIILVGVWMVMWISIRERTREIGTLRAVGMQRRRVLAMFLIEGFLLGAIGTTLGVAVGLGSAGLVNAAHITLPKAWQLILLADHVYLLPTVAWCMFAVIFTTMAITTISLIPSYLASRMKPVTAMSHIG
jgi:ABC-type antimicrobial peptide transport system permease subunit